MDVINSGVTSFYRSIYSVAEHAKEHGLVLYGAGFWGKVSGKLFSLFQVYPTCFCDDAVEKIGVPVEIEGRSIPTLSLDKAAQLFPNAVYISTATSGYGAPRSNMNRHLKERNLLGADSGFHPLRYLFLLEGGLEALGTPQYPGESSFTPERIDHMIVSSHMDNSGSVFFNTLLDGHPNILSIVMFGAEFFLKDLYLERLQYLEGNELVIETASQMTSYFSTTFDKSVFGNAIWRPADHYLTDENGDSAEGTLISAPHFVSSLAGILGGRGRVSFGFLLKAIFAAYHNVIGKQYCDGQEYWIYYERHKANYDMCEMDQLLAPDDFKRLEYWFVIREPVQHTFAWLKRCLLEIGPDMEWYVGRPELYLRRFSSDLGLMLIKTDQNRNKTVKIVRFEDVKVKPRETMQAICKWMNIKFDECMLDTTSNGLEVYFPASGKSGSGVISSRDTTAVERSDFSLLLSSYDVFRLNLVFQDFKRAYGYPCDMPDYHTFSDTFLTELFLGAFRFEPFLNQGTNKALLGGYVTSGGQLDCHTNIVELFMKYMKDDVHDFFLDRFQPEEGA